MGNNQNLSCTSCTWLRIIIIFDYELYELYELLVGKTYLHCLHHLHHLHQIPFSEMNIYSFSYGGLPARWEADFFKKVNAIFSKLAFPSAEGVSPPDFCINIHFGMHIYTFQNGGQVQAVQPVQVCFPYQ